MTEQEKGNNVQSAVIEFLQSSSGHPGGGPVETVQTHGALIFLAGEVALKIKRRVKYDYMDLSTLDLREAMLRRELSLNKPVAPDIYKDVVPVTRAPDGSLTLDGDGVPVEWVLRMWRFPAEHELSAIADVGGIDAKLADDLGREVFAYHQRTPLRERDGSKLIGDILDELDDAFAAMPEMYEPSLVARFLRQSRAKLTKVASELRRRGRAGHVRRCHGDLHLGNIVLLGGKPAPFDALEFDEDLGTCDVLYDLAFLIMDLRHRHLDQAANIVLNGYLLQALGREDTGLAALPLFIATRAAIRAMVAAQKEAATGESNGLEAKLYLDNAVSALRPEPASLVFVGGLSGTGKTTVSRALAPLIGAAPGAVHLRSDLERKAMRGGDSQTRLATTAYAPEARAKVYERLFNRATTVLATGHSVLIDATFLDEASRRAALDVARNAGVAVKKLWLDAPLLVLIDRVKARVGDASDADEDVVRRQFQDSVPPVGWQVVSAAGSPNETIRLAKNAWLDDQTL